MRDVISQAGTRAMFYVQQVAALRPYLSRAQVLLDIGCGPALPYDRRRVGCVVGLDLSYESLRQNRDVDLRLYASATRLPMPDRSVDIVVCFYSLHHFVGARVGENHQNLRAAFGEFGRVLKPRGDLIVFEVAPWRPIWWAQRGTWNLVRKILRDSLEMFFWPTVLIEKVSSEQLPRGTRFECCTFRVPALTVFPLIFSLPRLQIPRFLYPFEACLYHWRMGG